MSADSEYRIPVVADISELVQAFEEAGETVS
jgi:hypothetical protein